MNDLVDAAEKLNSLICLLKSHTGLALTANVQLRARAQEPSYTELGPELMVEFSGADLPMLLANDGELLYAIEHISTAMLDLRPAERGRIAFDAGGFRARRRWRGCARRGRLTSSRR